MNVKPLTLIRRKNIIQKPNIVLIDLEFTRDVGNSASELNEGLQAVVKIIVFFLEILPLFICF